MQGRIHCNFQSLPSMQRTALYTKIYTKDFWSLLGIMRIGLVCISENPSPLARAGTQQLPG